MLREGMDGFCMALADSVPGVSGGTVAFIMGFYDRFIGSIHDFAYGKRQQKKDALRYLAKMGTGWAAGMILAVFALSALFENHIYLVSSLFIGFIGGAVPLIVREEKDCIRQVAKGIGFFLFGLFLVVRITWLNGRLGGSTIDLGQFSAAGAVKLFFIGMAAISSMFLPGISGSTLLLIFGAYIPVITAVRGVFSLDFSYVPSLAFFGCGILAGALTVVKAIQVCLQRFRPQMVYMILGMMSGSFYTIVVGPTTLEMPQAALSPDTFHVSACIAGAALVFGMQLLKDRGAARSGKE